MSSGKGKLNVPGTQKGLGSNYGDICTIEVGGLASAPEPVTTTWAVLYWGNAVLLLGTFPHCCLGFIGTLKSPVTVHSSVLQLLLLIGMTRTITVIRWRIRLILYPGVYCCTLYEAR